MFLRGSFARRFIFLFPVVLFCASVGEASAERPVLSATLPAEIPICRGGGATGGVLSSAQLPVAPVLAATVSRSACALGGERSASACIACSDEVTEPMMAAIRPMLAAPDHRQWHLDFHTVPSQVAVDAQMMNAPSDPDFRSPGGADPAVEARARIEAWRASGMIQGDLDVWIRKHVQSSVPPAPIDPEDVSGEDFLYMHRRMIKMVQARLARAGQPCIAGFDPVPRSIDDAAWPSPIAAAAKTPPERAQWQARLDAVNSYDRKLRDPAYLASVSLSQLGRDIGTWVHLELHLIYGAPSRCSGDRDPSPTCDDLYPFWSGLVNKHFWKIHGYIDGFIGQWLGAHGLREIAERCDGRAGCYEWKGTWMAVPPSHGNHSP